jgi:hypothetical protein
LLSGKSLASTRPTALGSLLNASTYGMACPTYFGCVRGNLLAIWAQNLRQGGSGKKAKKKGITTYIEQIDFLIGSNPIQGMLQIWVNNSNPFALNFVEYSVAMTGAGTVTIPDSQFYFLVGVTAEVVLSGTFNDYGGQGSQAWGPTTTEYPLWNAALQGPDVVDASGARWWPYVYKWVPGDGATVTLPFVASFSAPAYGLPNANGTLHFYYAQLSATLNHVSPAAHARLTFESEIGNNNAAYAGFTAQQVIMPEFAGASSPDMDLGASGLIPQMRVEIMGSHSIYSRGDADFMDMIEDTLKSGMLQVGTQLGLIQRGVNLNDLPGPIQKNLFSQLEPLSPTLKYWQPNGIGNVLIGFCSWRVAGAGSAPTIADTSADTWTPIFATGTTLNVGMWYAHAVSAATANAVTFTYNGSGIAYDDHPFILEMDPGSQSVNATNSANGTSSGAAAVTCSITATGPAYIVAMFNCTQGFVGALPGPDSPWKNLFPAGDGSQAGVFGRSVAAAGTYTFTLNLTGGTPWAIGMIALAGTQPAPPYPKALGNILDSATALVARAGCRATGLIGSAVLDSQKKASDWLGEFYACANTAPVWSGFVLKSIFRSEVSVYGNGVVYTAPTAAGPVLNITENMLIGDKSGPLITVTNKTPAIDEPNVIQMEFLDRGGSYNPSVASWPNQASVAIYGPKKGGQADDDSTGSPQTLHEIMDPVVARNLLAIQARRNAYITPISYKFKGMAKLGMLEPMDLVTINDSLLGITALPVRLTSAAEDDEHNIDFEAEPFIYGVHAPNPSLTVTQNSPYVPNSSYTPASVNTPIIFEPVPRLAGQTTAQVWAVVSDSDTNYGGCAVYLSTDGGNSYNLVGTIAGNAVTGETTADWPIATDPDTTHDLPLNLTESLGSLLSYQVADEDNFVYPCYIAGGNSNIPYGLMTYAVATLTGTNLYTLKATGGGTNHLRRCVFGAPALVTDVDHPNGSRWAFLNPNGQGIFKINMDPKWIGQTLYFKFLAFNSFQGGQQALASVTAYTYTPTGIPGQATSGANNTYTVTGGALTNPTATTIAMAQATAEFQSGLNLNYNGRTFTIPTPTAPTRYYVTIADPGLTGDLGTTASLTATCQTSNALVGVAGNIYIGSIVVLPAGGGSSTGGGGSTGGSLTAKPLVSFYLGMPTAGQILLAFKVNVPTTLPANMAGAEGRLTANPTATAVYNIQQNGTTVGTISISTAGAFTFATTGGAAIQFNTGDEFKLLAPGPADATLADVGLTIVVEQ